MVPIVSHRGYEFDLGAHVFPAAKYRLVRERLLAEGTIAPQREGVAARALVVDLDVHHGNGTAAIFESDGAVFTFSMHQQQNYPAVKPPSDLDVGLPDGVGDGAYLETLEHHLAAILASHQPDVVFYLAGADPYREDQLGGLGLTIDGLKRRDAFVMDAAAKAHAPLAVVLAGGYARHTDDTVEIHCNTVRVAVART